MMYFCVLKYFYTGDQNLQDQKCSNYFNQIKMFINQMGGKSCGLFFVNFGDCEFQV